MKSPIRVRINGGKIEAVIAGAILIAVIVIFVHHWNDSAFARTSAKAEHRIMDPGR